LEAVPSRVQFVEGEQNMTSISKKFASLVAVFAVVVLLRTATLAEPTKVEGVIVGRSGSEIIVEYMQGAELAFLLDDSTKVSQTGGVFKARQVDGGADTGPEGQGGG
jgi:hypothetical protein